MTERSNIMNETTIQSVIDRLKERGATDKIGMMGDEVVIEKSTLNLAATYLKDYLFMIESLYNK